MSSRTPSNETIHDQAAAWTTLLDSGEMSEGELQRFHRWLGEPRNARALSECRSLLVLIQDLPKHKAASLVPLSHGKFPALARLFADPWRTSGVAAAAVALLVVGTWMGVRPAREFFTQTYETGTGESRTIVLPDSSVAYLNTSSRVRWVGSGKERGVALERGEALFEIAHDVTKPFRVEVGDSEIRDLATEFNVYRKDDGNVVLTVLSGQVTVKKLPVGGAPSWGERLLNPNEQLEFAADRLINDVHKVEAPKSILWREGLLETEGQSFGAIIGEMNRYSTKKIQIVDPRLQAADIRIGGMFGVHNVPAALERIQNLAPIVVTDTGGSFVLTYKADASVKEQSNATQQNAAGRP